MTVAKHAHLKLEKLRMQREKLSAQIEATEARLKTADRKKDTRKKILIGSCYLDWAMKENKMADILARLDGYLKRKADRELFGLGPLESEEQP